MKTFFQTDESINNLIIRVMLGIVLFPLWSSKTIWMVRRIPAWRHTGIPQKPAGSSNDRCSTGDTGWITGGVRIDHRIFDSFLRCGNFSHHDRCHPHVPRGEWFFYELVWKTGWRRFWISPSGHCLMHPLLIGLFSADGFIIKRFSFLLRGKTIN